MTKRNQGKKKTCLKKSTSGDYRRQQALVCPSRTRSDHMLTKVALLLVLLPHMAQTKYARGKKKAAEFFCFFYFLSLLVFPPWRDVCVKTFAQRETPPFRTLFWLAGRSNKLMYSRFDTNNSFFLEFKRSEIEDTTKILAVDAQIQIALKYWSPAPKTRSKNNGNSRSR